MGNGLNLNSLLYQIPPWGVALMVFVAVMSIVAGIVLIGRGFIRKPSEEELKRREVELAELETVAKLTQKDRRNGFDRWFSTLLEEGNSSLTPGTAALVVLAVMLLFGGVAFVLSENELLALGAGMVSMTFPMMFWMIRRSWRIRQMRKRLPETLEAVGDAIRGGLTIEEAIDMTAKQIEEPLKTEFQYANRQLEMGQAPQYVMDRMARRIPIPEFRVFTTAVMVHRTTGGNLAQLAERLARSARDRSEFLGHLNAISAGSRMSIVGLVIVTLVAVVILLGLDMSYLYKFLLNPYGPMLLGITVALFLIGGFWAWNIMRVRY
ncbi:MAG: type II secretion system F family protein [Planctomycetia bacterium]|nr:type II secretion system F family protein [Planctomycetia bacterium]